MFFLKKKKNFKMYISIEPAMLEQQMSSFGKVIH